ncbi:Protein of unknown function [Pseudomonas asplenii]|uniref:DUF3077 domain-containing protein n=1 Tax=Pseudomonas asplenii TaxID=53407 RepID=A0A1H6MP34_9PSED|nr:Protein of unknown function [Pseudomonas fuscovaginae]
MHNQFMTFVRGVQALAIALPESHGYSLPVAANSATGFSGPSLRRRTGATISIAGAFFVPAFLRYGGCARETLGSAGFLLTRSANPCIAATQIRLAAIRGSFHLRRSSTYALTQSVQNPRCCTSCNGSRRSSRQLQPPHSPLSLQLTHGKSSRSGSARGCAVNALRQEANTAGAMSFGVCNLEGQKLFRINPDIPIGAALEHASNLLDIVNRLTLAGGMDDGNETVTWAAHELGEMAKAIIDDVTTGLLVAGEAT